MLLRESRHSSYLVQSVSCSETRNSISHCRKSRSIGSLHTGHYSPHSRIIPKFYRFRSKVLYLSPHISQKHPGSEREGRDFRNIKQRCMTLILPLLPPCPQLPESKPNIQKCLWACMHTHPSGLGPERPVSVTASIPFQEAGPASTLEAAGISPPETVKLHWEVSLDPETRSLSRSLQLPLKQVISGI